MRHMRWIAAGSFAAAWVTTGAYAQAVPPPPPPPPPGAAPVAGTPSLAISLGYRNDATGRQRYAYSFSFPSSVIGTSFKPGERVTIRVEHATASPVTVNADASGHFLANVSFTWKFCGARAARATPPTFDATGDKGSSAKLVEPEAPCPQLAIPQSAAAVSASAGATVAFDGRGFGFVPGERVTIARGKANPYPAGTPVVAVADGQGRIRFHLTAFKPSVCSTRPKVYEIAAQGSAGSAIDSDLFWDQANQPCQGTGPTKGIPQVPQQGTDTGQGNRDRLAVSLSRFTAHPGTVQRVSIQADLPGVASLTARFPNRAPVRRSVDLKTSLHATLALRVPAGAGAGTVRLGLSFKPVFAVAGTPSLSTTFAVR